MQTSSLLPRFSIFPSLLGLTTGIRALAAIEKKLVNYRPKRPLAEMG